jgi:hypothetical protein
MKMSVLYLLFILYIAIIDFIVAIIAAFVDFEGAIVIFITAFGSGFAFLKNPFRILINSRFTLCPSVIAAMITCMNFVIISCF